MTANSCRLIRQGSLDELLPTYGTVQPSFFVTFFYFADILE
jgi:hypothetical protein